LGKSKSYVRHALGKKKATRRTSDSTRTVYNPYIYGHGKDHPSIDLRLQYALYVYVCSRSLETQVVTQPTEDHCFVLFCFFDNYLKIIG